MDAPIAGILPLAFIGSVKTCILAIMDAIISSCYLSTFRVLPLVAFFSTAPLTGGECRNAASKGLSWVILYLKVELKVDWEAQ